MGNYTERIDVRLDDGSKEILDKLCKKLRISQSEAVRFCILLTGNFLESEMMMGAMSKALCKSVEDLFNIKFGE